MQWLFYLVSFILPVLHRKEEHVTSAFRRGKKLSISQFSVAVNHIYHYHNLRSAGCVADSRPLFRYKITQANGSQIPGSRSPSGLKFCTLTAKICVSSICNLFYITVMVSGILRLLFNILNIFCALT